MILGGLTHDFWILVNSQCQEEKAMVGWDDQVKYLCFLSWKRRGFRGWTREQREEAAMGTCFSVHFSNAIPQCSKG